MVNFIVSGIVSALALAVCCCYLKFEEIKEKKSITVILPKNLKQTLFGVGMIVSVISVLLILSFLYDASWVFTAKRIVFCALLWSVALIDYRKHIIPNRILCLMLIARFAIAISELIYDFDSAKTELLSCVISCAVIIILLCLMRLIVRGGIGLGDIKLFAILGLYFGIKGSITTIFMSFFVSFIASVFMLLSKRKSRKDQIAFAPSILVGTLLSVILLGA